MSDPDLPYQIVQSKIDEYLSTRDSIRLLEGGCGSISWFDFRNKAHITGIDISQKQVDRNKNLNEAIVGDICTYPLERASYDIIICWDVLEHLDDPKAALLNFVRACRPGGMIIIGIPNLLSFKGMFTKLTPHIVHVWYYKLFMGSPDAGKNDSAPFRTTLKAAISPPAIKSFAKSQNVEMELCLLRESHAVQELRAKFWWLNAIMKTASAVSKTVTFGAIDALDSDCIFVLRTAA